MSTMNNSLPALVASAWCALTVACHDSGPVASAPPPGDCPPSWLEPPPVEPAIAAPVGAVHVVLHAKASGAQDYTCTQSVQPGADAGSVPAPGYAWKFAGPEASLADCRGAPVGRHFASEAGASAPQWQTNDGAFIVGHKVAASTPDGGAPAVPWLLLATDRAGGAGPLREATYVQRIGTAGGVAPTIACDASNAGVTRKVPYTADYFFYAPSR